MALKRNVIFYRLMLFFLNGTVSNSLAVACLSTVRNAFSHGRRIRLRHMDQETLVLATLPLKTAMTLM
jgi:hypothetical protein